MNLANFSSMEEIPLEDMDRASMEYRVLMAYVQCRLSASKYRQLLEGEVKGQEESAVGREDVEVASPEELSSEGQEQPSRKGTKKKKNKKRSNWKHFLLPSCLRPQEGKPQKIIAYNEDAVNGHVLMPHGGVGSVPASLPNVQDDSDITVVADRLAEIVDNSKFYLERTGKRLLKCTVSLEEDGGGASNIVYEGSDRKDEEAKIIDTIVSLLRKSGDELQDKMQKDKTFSQCISDLLSYAFFRKVADQFLEEVTANLPADHEVRDQSTKVAFAMELTARLTTMDRHPMNIMLGFGTKYLKEKFSPWITSQGGWEKL